MKLLVMISVRPAMLRWQSRKATSISELREACFALAINLSEDSSEQIYIQIAAATTTLNSEALATKNSFRQNHSSSLLPNLYRWPISIVLALAMCLPSATPGYPIARPRSSALLLPWPL